MQGKLRGDEGRSFIGAVIASLVMVLVSVVVFAGQAEMKKDKGGDDGKPKRIIHGKPENRRAVEALLEESEGDAEITAGPKTISRLEGKFKIDKNKPVEEAALDFIDRHRNAFGLQYAKKEFKLSEKKHRSSYGDAFIHYQQIYNDIPIWGKVLTVHQNKDQDIDLIISGNIPTPNIDTTPLITAEEAIGYAKADQNIPADVTPWPANAELMIYENLLAYMVEIDEWRYFIDAEKGSVISKTCTTRFEAVRGSQ